MKYDSGMTQYHNDIVEAIKAMIFGDADKVAELVAEGSPVPLREYLRDEHGKRYHGGNKFDSMSSAFLVLFDKTINNDGDTKLQLSWSQVAVFIRKYPGEIFNNIKPVSDSEEKSNMNKESYREVLKQQLPQLTDEMINRKTCCPRHFFNGDDVPLIYGVTCNDGDESLCPACWDKPCEGTYNGEPFDPEDWECDSEKDDKKQTTTPEEDPEPEISDEEFVKQKSELEEAVAGISDKSIKCPHWCKGETVKYKNFGAVDFECKVHKESFFNAHKFKTFINNHCYNSEWCNYCHPSKQPAPQNIQPPAEQADSSPAEFDYSVLNGDDAEIVKQYRERHIHRQQAYYLDEAKDLAEIQSRLAKYGVGVFNKWIESETEYSTTAAYRLIDIHNSFSQLGKTEQKTFTSLPKTLQYDISAKSAPPELVEQVMSGDITTHKEYIELKRRLEEAEKKESLIRQELDKTMHELDEANFHVNHNEQKLSEKIKKIRKLNEENASLEKQIKELESRPIDVAFDPDEVNRRVEEAVNKINTETERTLSAERKEFADTLNEKDDRIWALEDKIRKLEKIAPSQKKYIAVLTEEQVKKYGIKTIVEVK